MAQDAALAAFTSVAAAGGAGALAPLPPDLLPQHLADPRRLADMGSSGPYAPGPGGLDAGGGGGLAYAGGPLVAGDFASPPPLPLSEEERGRGGEEQRYAAGALDVLAGAAPQHM